MSSTTENLLNYDMDDEIQKNHEIDKSKTNSSKNYQKILSDENEEIIFSCDNDGYDVRLSNESQPLLGGNDHHEVHQIIYNQFPSRFDYQHL